MTAVGHRMVRWRGTMTLAAVLLLAMGIAQTGFGHAVLARTGLYQPPVSYTSLAFENSQRPVPATLPATSPVQVAFVIHNSGTTSQVYQWSVNVARASQTQRAASGVVTLSAGHGIGITQQAHVSCTSAGKVRVTVSLVHPAESIDAWTACPSPRK